MRDLMKLFCMILLLIGAVNAAADETITTNIVDEFPTYQGENGFYAQYHYSYPNAPQPYYNMVQDSQNPLKYSDIYNNSLISSIEQTDDKILLRPGYGGSFGGIDATYSWVATQSGSYHVTGKFSYISAAYVGSVSVAVYVDDACKNPQYVTTLYQYLDSGSFDLNLNLKANQTIRFVAFACSYGTNMSVGLTGRIINN